MRVTDTTSGGADYYDEATGDAKDLAGDLRAVTVISGTGNYTVNVTPVTELAVRELGLSGGDNGTSSVKLGTVTAADITNANSNPAVNAYGLVLAAISGMEEGTGKTTDQILDDLAAGVNVNDSTMDATVKNELIAGLFNVESQSGQSGNVAELAQQLGVDTTAATAIEDAWDAIRAAADGTDDDATTTQAQYASIGVTGVDSTVKESLLGDVIDIKNNPDVDTVAEVQALADTVNKLMLHAAGTPQTVSQAELENLGLTNLTPGRTVYLLNKVNASADDGTEIDTLAELQGDGGHHCAHAHGEHAAGQSIGHFGGR